MDSDLQVVKGMSFRTGQLTEWVKWKSLGVGGFGDVYLATVTKPVPRLVAVKYSSSPSPSLQKEYRVLRRFLGCPNIVQCYGEVITIEHGVTNHNLLLEYANRGSLLSLIKKYGRKIPESDVRHYTKAIVEGLCVIHEKGYVHCDIKPQNILVYCSNQSNSLKIADFGLAKEPGERDVDAIVSPYHRGTFNYMSPEAAYEGKISAARDIWALGCTIVEMMTGKLPSMETPNTVPPRMSMSGKDFLMRCFAKDPSQRWTAKRLLTHEFLRPNYAPKMFSLPHEMMHQNRHALNPSPQVVHRC